MVTVGEFIKKVSVTKENIYSIKVHSSFSIDFKIGENAYAVKYYFGGPYNSIDTYLSRNTVLETLRDNKVILGLKLDSIGRIIEDNTYTKEYQDDISKLKNMIRKEMKLGYFTYEHNDYDDNDSDSESTKSIKSLAAKLIIGTDAYEINEFIENVICDMGNTETIYTGRVYRGDVYKYYASYDGMKLITNLASMLSSYGYPEDKDYIQSRFEPDHWNDRAELWAESCQFNEKDLKSTIIALKEMKGHCTDAMGEAYGDGVNYNEAVEGLLDNLETRYFDDIGLLMFNIEKNIKALRELKFRANDPKETLQKYVKKTKSTKSVDSQGPEDYFGLLLAIMTVYCKNQDSIKCLGSDCIEIEKLGVTIKVEPYKINITTKE